MQKSLTFAQELDRFNNRATLRKLPQPHIPRGRALFRELQEAEMMTFGRAGE